MSALAAFQKRIQGVCGQRVAWSAADVARIARHYGLSLAGLPAPTLSTRRAPDMVLRDQSADGRIFRFIASTGEVDRMGDVISPKGWRLSAFKQNPVVLYAHDSSSLPVGRAISVGVEGDKLVASVRFAQTSMGRAVAGLIASGNLNAVSVGFVPLDYEFAKTANRRGGIDFTSTELLEISVVPVPANASALLTGIAEDNGREFSAPKAAKARRERDLELIRLRLPPLGKREQRIVDLARMKARS